MTPAEYKAAMKELFGSERSNKQMAELLPKSYSTCRAWSSGKTPIPDADANHIRLRVKLKRLAMSDAADPPKPQHHEADPSNP